MARGINYQQRPIWAYFSCVPSWGSGSSPETVVPRRVIPTSPGFPETNVQWGKTTKQTDGHADDERKRRVRYYIWRAYYEEGSALSAQCGFTHVIVTASLGDRRTVILVVAETMSGIHFTLHFPHHTARSLFRPPLPLIQKMTLCLESG